MQLMHYILCKNNQNWCKKHIKVGNLDMNVDFSSNTYLKDTINTMASWIRELRTMNTQDKILQKISICYIALRREDINF
jgi:hypothetical protein